MKLKVDFSAQKESRYGRLFSIRLNDYSFFLKADKNPADIFKKFLEDGTIPEGKEESHGWKIERKGLYKTAYLKLPFSFGVEVYKHRMSYAEAVGFDSKIDVDWIIDEFDSSFNALAVASLRYHMNFSVATMDNETRKQFENLVEKFESLNVRFTAEELEHMRNCPTSALKRLTSEGCETCKAASVRLNTETKLAEKREKAARHEFIRILPNLWS